MNKKIFIAIIAVLMLIILSSCGNRQVGIDGNQTFTKAYIRIGDNWELKTIKSWRDFDGGDEIQVLTDDGIVYLTHYNNMVLMSK